MKLKLLSPILSIALVTLLVEGVLAAQTEALTEQQTKEIEKVLENYLDRNPQVISAALRKAMENEHQAQQQKVKENLVKYKEQIFDDPEAPTAGNAKAKIVLVVFLDPYCGYCRKFEAVLQDVAQKRKDFKIIYKILPILGPESEKASKEQLAAHMQNKFTQFTTALNESQAADRKARLELAKATGLDIEQLKKDSKSSHVRESLKNNLSLAKVLGINGTPAFIVGDTFVSGMVDAAALNKILDKAR